MSIEWTKRRPSMHTSPRAWEKSWEADLNRNWEHFRLHHGNLASYFTPEAAMELTSITNDEYTVFKLANEEDALRNFQRNLAEDAAICFTEEDFENRWRTMDPKEREEMVMEGIFQTMSTTGDLDERRE